MKDFLRKGLALGFGLAAVSREQIEKFVDEMVKRGEVSSSESKDLLKDLLEKGENEKKEFNNRLHDQMERLLKEFNVATKADIQGLEARIAELEERLKNSETAGSNE